MQRRVIALAAVLLSVGFLSACGPNASDSKEAQDKLLGRLTEARAKIDKAETINLTLSAKTLPDGLSGLMSASGKGNHSPAFQGTVKVVTGGAAVSAEVFATDGEVWAKPSFSPIPLKIDPATLKAPDPALLFEPETGFSQVLVETTELQEAGKSRDGKDVLTTVSGKIAGSVVRAILPSADTEASFTATYRLTDDNELRDASITGPFYPDVADVTYDLTLSTSSKPFTVELPK